MAEIPSDKQEEDVKEKCCTPGWCKKNSKQLIILGILIILIVYLIIDQITKGCVLYEQPKARNHRLTCEVGKNWTKMNVSFLCKSDGDGNDAWEPYPSGKPTRCGKTSACVTSGIDGFLNWISDNIAAGVFVFMLAYVVVTVAFLPASLLTIGSGVTFGGALGLGPGTALASVSCWAGATVGSALAFLLGRFLFREWVEGLTKKFAILQSIDLAVQKKGFLTVGLLRFSPAIPYNVFNYIMGATAVSFKDYVMASATCMIPGTVAYVFIGAVIGSAVRGGDGESCEEGDNTVQIVILVVGIVATIVAVVLISVVAKKQLNEILSEAGGENGNTEEKDSKDKKVLQA